MNRIESWFIVFLNSKGRICWHFLISWDGGRSVGSFWIVMKMWIGSFIGLNWEVVCLDILHQSNSLLMKHPIYNMLKTSLGILEFHHWIWSSSMTCSNIEMCLVSIRLPISIHMWVKRICRRVFILWDWKWHKTL